jgi:hypothetical protein
MAHAAKSRRNLWPFSSGKKRVTRTPEELRQIAEEQRASERHMLATGRRPGKGSSSAPASSGSTSMATTSYKGYTIRPTGDGEYFIPKLDPDSHFDTLSDAKRFLDSWKQNPETWSKVIKGAQSQGKQALKLYDSASGTIWNVTGGLPRRIAGYLVGQKGNPTDKQAAYIMHLLDQNGFPTRYMTAQFKALGATMRERSGSVRDWVSGLSGAQASALIDRLKGMRMNGTGNPQEAAEELYESFHGKPPEGLTIVKEEIHEHEFLAPLGVLVNFKVATLTGINATVGVEENEARRQDYDETEADGDTIFLAANEEGTQLYFRGGDQSLDLDRLKFTGDWVKDDMIIGVLYEITYRTRKKFDKFELTDYFHHLGEETGDQPMLRYDPLSPHLYVTGGKYKIKMPLIGMSPGIEN